MLVALPRGAKHLALVLVFILICALFWTLELPTPEGLSDQSDTSRAVGSIFERRRFQAGGQNDGVAGLSLQAPAPNFRSAEAQADGISPKNLALAKRNDREGIRVNSVKAKDGGLVNQKYDDDIAVNEDNNEKVVIEDAFNTIQLKPLPSDIDTNSNQSTIDVILFAKYAFSNMKIPRGVQSTIRSILRHTQTTLHVHILADIPSFVRIRRIFGILRKKVRTSVRYSLYDVEEVERRERQSISLIRRFFFARGIQRYNDDIFFMTPFFHRIFAGKLQRAIFLDADLQFRADIADLWAKFAEFTKDNLIGIAHDLQPHYRKEFSLYRLDHANSDAGLPRPGKQGFNTGVMLMDFDRMSNSKTYNNLLDKKKLRELTDKYSFYGILGHQDFFTLLGVEYPEMFYLLDCSWNRQLDTTYNTMFKKEIFDLYHKCPGPVRVYHGNGDHLLPQEPTIKTL